MHGTRVRSCTQLSIIPSIDVNDVLLVGTVVEIGRVKTDPATMKPVLRLRMRTLPGPVADGECHMVVCRGELAWVTEATVKPGRRIEVTGALKTRFNERVNGAASFVCEIIAESIRRGE